MKAVLGFTIWQAFWSGALGWAVLQATQRTVGRSVTKFGRWLSNSVAGVNLVTDLKNLEKRMESSIETKLPPPDS
ncbi:hypothetical protein [Leptothermofonsia sp. ETS-13]|uniref:hypothetical protein n=1 Tax=Leptothermofonsia sp. ETS-13 TaxID=3035696 RepID=UPI003BA10EF9